MKNRFFVAKSFVNMIPAVVIKLRQEGFGAYHEIDDKGANVIVTDANRGFVVFCSGNGLFLGL